MSTMRYVLGFAVAVPGQPRGAILASHEGRKFLTVDRAVEVMEAESRPLVTLCVIDIGTMRVIRSSDYSSIRLDEKAKWVKPEKAAAKISAPVVVKEPVEVDEPETIEDDDDDE